MDKPFDEHGVWTMYNTDKCEYIGMKGIGSFYSETPLGYKLIQIINFFERQLDAGILDCGYRVVIVKRSDRGELNWDECYSATQMMFWMRGIVV